MKPTTKLIIQEWSIANDAAHNNPSLLLDNHILFSDLCVSKMHTLGIIEKLLLAIDDNEEPPELHWYREAVNARPCPECSLSSVHPMKHPECACRAQHLNISTRMLLLLGREYAHS